MEEEIRILLKEVSNDITKITELEKYDAQKIVDVALKEKIYESLLIIFKPITINGVTKIYFDAFSTDLLDKIKYTCDTKEQAEKEAQKEYEYHQKMNATLSEEDKEWYYDDRTYGEILSSKTIIPKEFKDTLKKMLFSIDMNLIGKIKIKDSHARQISGIGHPIYSIEDVIFYSEPACIKSCIELFNKNIVTTMNDTEGVIEDGIVKNGKCFITCDYKSLSEENKKVLDELIKNGMARRFMDGSIDSVSINVSCNGEETVKEISDKLQAIVSKLKAQDFLYGKQTLEDFYENNLVNLGNIYSKLYQKYFDKDECTWDDVIMFAKDIGYYYDSKEDLLWKNKNYYYRHHRYIQTQKESNEEQIYDAHYENGVESVSKKI